MKIKKMDIKKIKVGKSRFRTDLGDVKSLAHSIKEEGQLHPLLVDPNGNLLDGKRRLTAFKKIGRKKAEVIICYERAMRQNGYYDFLKEVPYPKRVEIISNLLQKQLTISERVKIGLYAEPFVKKRAKDRMFHKVPQGNFPEGYPQWRGHELRQARDIIGWLLEMDGRTYEKAKVVYLSGNKKYIKEMDESGKVEPFYLAVVNDAKEPEHKKKKEDIAAGYKEIEKTGMQDIIRTAKYETMFKNFLHNRIVSRPCDFLGFFRNETIDCILTSPPYDKLRDYDNGQAFTFEDFKKAARELARILKPGGVIVWVVGDQTYKGSETGTSFRQVLFFMDECGLNLHDTMIFEKNGARHPARVWEKRYSQASEYMFVLSKGEPKTAKLICDRENRCAGVENRVKSRKKDGSLIPYIGKTIPKFSVRTNIWRYVVGSKVSSNSIAFQHPAVFPEALVRDHLQTWTEEGDVVLDPFNGSGTTTVVAKNMKRRFIGLDISAKYCELAAVRLEDTLDLEKLRAMSQKSNNQKEELKSRIVGTTAA